MPGDYMRLGPNVPQPHSNLNVCTSVLCAMVDMLDRLLSGFAVNN